MTVKEEDKIVSTMTIDEIFTRFPQKAQKLAQVLTGAGLHCVGCSASTWETIEAGVLGHGMSEDVLKKLLHDLNQTLEEESNPETITVTKRAVDKFKEICKTQGKANWSLRLDEKPAGCSGFEYTLDFSEKALDDDTIYSSNGVDVHVKTKAISRLVGSEIDYIDGLQSGFKISNPNVRSSCGCGNSHGY